MPAVDPYLSAANRLTGPIVGAFAVSPDDEQDLPKVTRQLYAAGAGDIAVVWLDGSETVEPIAAGERVDWRVSRVKATGTTATGIRGYY
jgi:hypothetical protein